MKKRVFMIGYSTDKGGVESYIKNLCREWQDEFDIVLHWPEMVIDGKIWKIPHNRHNYIKYCNFWRNFYRKNHFDAIYFNTCDIISIDTLKFAKDAGVPIRIIHSHSTGNQIERGGIIGVLHKIQERDSRKNINKYATHLLACSKSAGDWMFGLHKYTVIKNGIEIDNYIYSDERRTKIASCLKNIGKPVIACLGRLDTQKNPFFSLEIFKEICRLNPEAQCLFIGDGEHREELKSKVKKAELQEKIIFTGPVDNVNEWLSYVDCLLMPSLFEGLPFALVEAQAAGIRSLVSDTVSGEANITRLVEYMSLEKQASEWAQRAFELAALPKMDVSDKLIEAGFSIHHSAKIVKDIINGTSGKI